MSRRLLPLLIAVFLLLSQQVAATHVYSHFVAVAVAQAGSVARQNDAATTVEPSAIEQLCGLCLGAADLAFAMPGTIVKFDPAADKLQQLLIACLQPLARATRVVFLSRAPPLQ